MKWAFAIICWTIILLRSAITAQPTSQRAERVSQFEVPADCTLNFVRFQDHSFAPDSLHRTDGTAVEVRKDPPIVVSPFQRVTVETWHLLNVSPRDRVNATRRIARDAFWDQMVTWTLALPDAAHRYEVAESGEFASSLPPHVRAIDLSASEIAAMQSKLVDPGIDKSLSHEMSWQQIESQAWPLDFQKVLLASPHDSSPAFAFQNGQWFTTWLSDDLPKWNKEDHWFVPTLLINGKLIQPAPLSAKLSFLTTSAGTTLPCVKIEWSHDGTEIIETLFSHRVGAKDPQLFARFEVRGKIEGRSLAIGMGRRPNVHYWDEKSRERSPLPFFTLPSRYKQSGKSVIDGAEHLILRSSTPFRLEPAGPVEMIANFDLVRDQVIDLVMPQTPQPVASAVNEQPTVDGAYKQFEAYWKHSLQSGAQAKLPSDEWMKRIDIWRSQVEAITRVNYNGGDNLSYGAYFYQYYFGIEEGWPAVALAQLGCADEAKRQIEIMLRADNLSKDNVHHQSRNGIGPACAAKVARLTDDAKWLESVAPAMIECAKWTQRVRGQNSAERSPLTKGLIPPHIYGGDVRDKATSLYASAACWHGLITTADAFEKSGDENLKQEAVWIRKEADSLRQRVEETAKAVAVGNGEQQFVPFGLELPSLNGQNEGPHEQLTQTRLGNYWNLFAPSFLELRFGGKLGEQSMDDAIFNWAQSHGGLWCGLPRFNNGLDAAYAIGNISYLIDRSTRDPRYRPVALASLESFFLHAASRNGYTIPEVAGLFPERLNRQAYEKLVRESPWSFGMYDAQDYLAGRISFTEPLGAGAGEALTMIRDSLITETHDANGLPDGGLFLLAAVPEDWMDEGKVISLQRFPTAYGVIDVEVHSQRESKGIVQIATRFEPHRSTEVPSCRIRIAMTNGETKDIALELNTTIEVNTQ